MLETVYAKFSKLFRPRRSTAEPGLAAACAAASLTVQAWLAVEPAADEQLYGPAGAELDGELMTRFEACRARLCAAADDAVAHRFNLLGSGPYTCVDDQRAADDGYVPIDWYFDPVRGVSFPRAIPIAEWDYFAMRPEGADIKYPWELARCQHWVNLAQLAALTGEVEYAREIERQLNDFLEVNPVGFGVNWTCTMDVGIRAVNWALAVKLVEARFGLEAPLRAPLYAALFAHGEFIFAHLENNYEVTSNHYLSNLLGLLFIGVVFRRLRAGRAWLDFARAGIAKEMHVQVLADGADFESSVPYHRLVCELFLAAARLGELHGEPFPDDYLGALERMLDFLVATLRPDGLMPQFGDADDGRLHVFAGCGHWQPQDPRHLCGPAGILLGRADLVEVGGRDGLWEALWWGYDVSALSAGGEIPACARLFPDAGIAVVREQDNYLAVTNGRVGTEGFGNHKHNDLLSFEFHHRGEAVVVDPGSYVYTSDFDARNHFRSVAAHNGVQINGHEPNEFKSEWLFRMFEHSEPEHLEFNVQPAFVEYRGGHRGYARHHAGLGVQRTLRYIRGCGALCIVDELSGDGVVTVTWRLHLAPGIDARREADHWHLAGRATAVRVRGPNDIVGACVAGAYSPSYGVRHDSAVLEFETRIDLAETRRWALSLCPATAAAAEDEIQFHIRAMLGAADSRAAGEA